MSHQTARRVGPAYTIRRALILFVYGFAIACIVILAMAFFLQLFNANTTAPFVDWVYRAARRIMQPFRGIFPSVEGGLGVCLRRLHALCHVHVRAARAGCEWPDAWIDRKIAAIRYESMRQAAATPAASSDVVTIPTGAPTAYSTVPEVTAPPGGPRRGRGYDRGRRPLILINEASVSASRSLRPQLSPRHARLLPRP
jgi:uncharacterized protein YggT (Ycf19 family)